MPNWKKVIVSGSDASLNSLIAPSITGSLQGTASVAITSLTSYGNQGLPKRFIEPNEEYNIREGLQYYLYDMYNFGTINISPATMTMPIGPSGSISNEGSMLVEELYNDGIINIGGILQITNLRKIS
jgi:hypothetical protein